MRPEALLAAIRDGDCHHAGLRCLRLFHVERELALALRAEVLQLCRDEACSDVQEREHVTNWAGPHGAVRQFSLLNRSGDFADYRDDHDLTCAGKRFRHGRRYPRLAGFIAGFPGAVNFRVNLLGAGAGLAPHEEHSLYPNGDGTASVRARFHLPLHTSRAARMMLDGDIHRFLPRTIYYFNQGCVHAADNRGGTERIHLVWDMLLTQPVFELMFGAAPAPAGLRRIDAANGMPRLLGRIVLPSYARLPPRVTLLEARRLVLAPPPE